MSYYDASDTSQQNRMPQLSVPGRHSYSFTQNTSFGHQYIPEEPVNATSYSHNPELAINPTDITDHENETKEIQIEGPLCLTLEFIDVLQATHQATRMNYHAAANSSSLSNSYFLEGADLQNGFEPMTIVVLIEAVLDYMRATNKSKEDFTAYFIAAYKQCYANFFLGNYEAATECLKVLVDAPEFAGSKQCMAMALISFLVRTAPTAEAWVKKALDIAVTPMTNDPDEPGLPGRQVILRHLHDLMRDLPMKVDIGFPFGADHVNKFMRTARITALPDLL